MSVALSYGSCGITFGQFLRGDTIKDKRDLKSLLRNKSIRLSRNIYVTAEAANPVHIQIPEETSERSLSLTYVKLYGTEAWDLLDSGASSKILS